MKTFDYTCKAEAEACMADLKARGKGAHFVRSLKEPIGPDSLMSEPGQASALAPLAQRLAVEHRPTESHRHSALPLLERARLSRRPGRPCTSWVPIEPSPHRKARAASGRASRLSRHARLGITNVERRSMPRTIARAIFSVGSPCDVSSLRGS